MKTGDWMKEEGDEESTEPQLNLIERKAWGKKGRRVGGLRGGTDGG